MNITVRTIRKEDFKIAHAFQCEYLDQETFGEFVLRVEANPDLYLVAFDQNSLVGLCYGRPSPKNTEAIHLQGIAVELDSRKSYARKGIGSMLIGQFGKAVKAKGYTRIEVGSADDLKVESFYLKNGFHPYEVVCKGPNGEEYERVNIVNYESGKIKQEELRKKYQAKEVIFIFAK